MELSPAAPAGNPFAAVASAASTAANAMSTALKRPPLEGSVAYHEATTEGPKRPVGDAGFTGKQKEELAEILQRLVMDPLKADIKALQDKQATQADEVAGLKSRVDVLAAKTVDNGDITELVKSEVKKQAEVIKAEMKAQSAPSSPRPSHAIANPCAFSQADVDAVKDRLEIRVAAQIKDAQEAKDMLANVLAQASSSLEDVGATIVGNPKYAKGESRVRIKLADKDARDACRERLVSGPPDYETKTKYKGQEVTAWLVRPRFEIMRDNRIYDAAGIECKSRGLNPADNKLDRKLRVMTNGDQIVAHQCKETWAARRGAPA